jgi:hypothetical protein
MELNTYAGYVDNLYLTLVTVNMYHCRPAVSQDIVVLVTYYGKPNTSVILLCEKTTARQAWEW